MSLNTRSEQITLKDTLSYDEKWFLVNEQIEELLKKYWLPLELIDYFLDAYDNARSEWKNSKPKRIGLKLEEYALKADSGYVETILKNFSFGTIHYINFLWMLKSVSKISEGSSVEAEFPLNTLIREWWMQRLPWILHNIEEWIKELQWMSVDSTEQKKGRDLLQLAQEEALELLEGWMQSDKIFEQLEPKRNEGKILLQYKDSIDYLIWYLKIIYYEIKNYNIEINNAIQLLKRAYWDSLIDVLNSADVSNPIE